jgi:hypothetical protein
VAEHDEEVNRLSVVDCSLEPRLGNGVVGLDHTRDVAVAGEVVEETHGHNTETHAGGEVSVLMTDVLKLVGSRVDDLHVGGEVAITVDLGELAECLVCNVTEGELAERYSSSRGLYSRDV